MQLFNLNNYRHLSPRTPDNTFSPNYKTMVNSNGLGAIGLPGDCSSMSRIVKASFVKSNSKCKEDETSSVNQFFHILGSVEHPRGSVEVNNLDEITVYSSCCNMDKGIYYYRTYDNSQIIGVDMFLENLEQNSLISHPLITAPEFFIQNR